MSTELDIIKANPPEPLIAEYECFCRLTATGTHADGPSEFAADAKAALELLGFSVEVDETGWN